MKIFFILQTHINNLPPARNILLDIVKRNIYFVLITMYSKDLPKELLTARNVTIVDLQGNYSNNKIEALFNRFKRRKKLRKYIKNNIKDEDYIWTFTDYDAMECGSILLKHKHIMQLMELIKDIPYFDELPFLKANIKRYAKNAIKVIVPEENRAYIQQIYWDLDNRPYVIHNKNEIIETRKNLEEYNKQAFDKIEKIKDKKIILYQGTFGYERRLDEFIEAVNLLGNEYCLLLMGSKTIDLDRLLEKYPNVKFIDFIPNPYHLLVTKYAYIGILSYVNTKCIKHFDPLNSTYCAPNKIFEYSYFGIPMIGNDIPGLNIPFRTYNCGISSLIEKYSIAKAIKEIDRNYKQMSDNAKKFYSSISISDEITQILNSLENKQ